MKALRMLREWSRDGRLGSMLERVLRIPSYPDTSNGAGTRYVSRPSMDFPEEVPPVDLGCPLLDCEAIEESLACAENDREPTAISTVEGVQCDGCRRCSPKVVSQKRPAFSHFPFGGCPRLDCPHIEASLACPTANRELEYFHIANGKECTGCMKCVTVEDDPTPSPISLDTPNLDEGERSQQPGSNPCPMLDCEIIELTLTCDEDSKKVEYFHTDSGERCPGCRSCPTGEFPEADGIQSEDVVEHRLQPQCPSLDCQIVEEFLTCGESEREVVYFESPDGLTCPGCRQCRPTPLGPPPPNIEDDILPEGSPPLGASPIDCPLFDCLPLPCPHPERQLDFITTETGVRCPRCEICREPLAPPRREEEEEDIPVVEERSACPLIDCSEVEDQLPCPLTHRQLTYFPIHTGVLCPGCEECRPRLVLSDDVTAPPTIPSTIPLPRGCPLLDCEALEEGLPCPPSQRKWTTYRIASGQICPGCKRCIR